MVGLVRQLDVREQELLGQLLRPPEPEDPLASSPDLGERLNALGGSEMPPPPEDPLVGGSELQDPAAPEPPGADLLAGLSQEPPVQPEEPAVLPSFGSHPEASADPLASEPAALVESALGDQGGLMAAPGPEIALGDAASLPEAEALATPTAPEVPGGDPSPLARLELAEAPPMDADRHDAFEESIRQAMNQSQEVAPPIEEPPVVPSEEPRPSGGFGASLAERLGRGGDAPVEEGRAELRPDPAESPPAEEGVGDLDDLMANFLPGGEPSPSVSSVPAPEVPAPAPEPAPVPTPDPGPPQAPVDPFSLEAQGLEVGPVASVAAPAEAAGAGFDPLGGLLPEEPPAQAEPPVAAAPVEFAVPDGELPQAPPDAGGLLDGLSPEPGGGVPLSDAGPALSFDALEVEVPAPAPAPEAALDGVPTFDPLAESGIGSEAPFDPLAVAQSPVAPEPPVPSLPQEAVTAAGPSPHVLGGSPGGVDLAGALAGLEGDPSEGGLTLGGDFPLEASPPDSSPDLSDSGEFVFEPAPPPAPSQDSGLAARLAGLGGEPSSVPAGPEGSLDIQSPQLETTPDLMAAPPFAAEVLAPSLEPDPPPVSLGVPPGPGAQQPLPDFGLSAPSPAAPATVTGLEAPSPAAPAAVTGLDAPSPAAPAAVTGLDAPSPAAPAAPTGLEASSPAAPAGIDAAPDMVDPFAGLEELQPAPGLGVASGLEPAPGLDPAPGLVVEPGLVATAAEEIPPDYDPFAELSADEPSLVATAAAPAPGPVDDLFPPGAPTEAVVPGVESTPAPAPAPVPASVDLGDDLAALARRPSAPRPQDDDDEDAPTRIYVPSQQQAANQRGEPEEVPEVGQPEAGVWEQDFYELFAQSRQQAHSFRDEELLDELCKALAEVRKAAS